MFNAILIDNQPCKAVEIDCQHVAHVARGEIGDDRELNLLIIAPGNDLVTVASITAGHDRAQVATQCVVTLAPDPHTLSPAADRN